jgi:hypothetical protein
VILVGAGVHLRRGVRFETLAGPAGLEPEPAHQQTHNTSHPEAISRTPFRADPAVGGAVPMEMITVRVQRTRTHP